MSAANDPRKLAIDQPLKGFRLVGVSNAYIGWRVDIAKTIHRLEVNVEWMNWSALLGHIDNRAECILYAANELLAVLQRWSMLTAISGDHPFHNLVLRQ